MSYDDSYDRARARRAENDYYEMLGATRRKAAELEDIQRQLNHAYSELAETKRQIRLKSDDLEDLKRQIRQAENCLFQLKSQISANTSNK